MRLTNHHPLTNLTHARSHKTHAPLQYDLYTQASSVPVMEEVWPFYQGIIDKLCPGELDW